MRVELHIRGVLKNQEVSSDNRNLYKLNIDGPHVNLAKMQTLALEARNCVIEKMHNCIFGGFEVSESQSDYKNLFKHIIEALRFDFVKNVNFIP